MGKARKLAEHKQVHAKAHPWRNADFTYCRLPKECTGDSSASERFGSFPCEFVHFSLKE